jgi:NRAMP (natural resistance-associated macrophage protein)-like metal ion transporter
MLGAESPSVNATAPLGMAAQIDAALLSHRMADGEVAIDDDSEDEAEPLPDERLRFRFSWRKLWRFAGPGWLMSLAYLDPGNLESSLQQGAYTNFKLVWVLWWATVMGLILQEMAARIGLVTGMDLAQMVRAFYPRWLNVAVYFMMEIAVIGADIQEVVGSGVAINLLTSGALPVWAGCLITAIDTFTFLAVQYFGVRYLEALVCVLIGTMSICFFINWGSTQADAAQFFEGWVVPTVPSYGLTQAVGTIGAVIMPHNLYLHSGLVLSRKVKRQSPHKVYDAIWYARIESAGALLFAFFINAAVVATNSATFFSESCTNLTGGPYACMDPVAFNRSGNHATPGAQGTA